MNILPKVNSREVLELFLPVYHDINVIYEWDLTDLAEWWPFFLSAENSQNVAGFLGVDDTSMWTMEYFIGTATLSYEPS